MHFSRHLEPCGTCKQAVSERLLHNFSFVCEGIRVEFSVLGSNGDSAVSIKLRSFTCLSQSVCMCRVMQRGLHCIQQLTSADWLKQPQHRGLLQAFVRAFGRQSYSPEQEPNSKAGVLKASEARAFIGRHGKVLQGSSIRKRVS